MINNNNSFYSNRLREGRGLKLENSQPIFYCIKVVVIKRNYMPSFKDIACKSNPQKTKSNKITRSIAITNYLDALT